MLCILYLCGFKGDYYWCSLWQLHYFLVADGNQFMPAFGLAHCLSMRQQFTSMDRDIMADGNIVQRSIHLRRKRRDLPQTSSLPKFAENHELGSANIFMDPSFYTKATESSSTENKSSSKPPKFLGENSSRRPHHRTVSILLSILYSSLSTVHFRNCRTTCTCTILPS